MRLIARNRQSFPIANEIHADKRQRNDLNLRVGAVDLLANHALALKASYFLKFFELHV
jgi:hypothetical protein